MFAAIKESADKVLAASKPGKEHNKVEQRMAQIQVRWDKVQKDTADRQALLEQLEPVAQKYEETLQETLPWLTLKEKALGCLSVVPCSRKPLANYENALKEIREDVSEREEARRNLNELGRAVLLFYPEDQDVVKALVQNVELRWETLEESLTQKEENLEKVKELLDTFHERLHSVEELVVKAVILCASVTPIMNPDGVRGELNLINDMLAALDDKEDELDLAQGLGLEVLERLGVDSPDGPLIRQQIQTLYTRFRVVRVHLEKRMSQLEKHAEHLTPFIRNTDELVVWFVSITEKMGNWEPISTEPAKIKEQLKEAEEMQDSVQEERLVLEAALEDGDWMMVNNKEDENVTVAVVSQLSEAQMKMDRIAAKVDERKDKLQDAVLECQDVQVTFAEFLDDLNSIEDQLASMRPVSGVHDTLKEQEREHKVKIITKIRVRCKQFAQIQNQYIRV